MKDIKFTAGIKKLSSYFEINAKYLIPDFQRWYTWEQKTHWQPLWKDITMLAEKQTKSGNQVLTSHFMGAVILKENSTESSGEIVSKRTIIDGQQRFVTWQIAIVAICSVLKDKGLVNFKSNAVQDQMQQLTSELEKYIYNLKCTQDDKYKLNLSQSDFNVYKEILNNDVTDKNSALSKCYSYFSKEVNSWLEGEEKDIAKKAIALKDSLIDKIIICSIDVPPNENEYMIFESMNARGKPLTEWDKVKNLFLSTANLNDIDTEQFYADFLKEFDYDWWKDKIDRYLNYWLEIELNQDVPSTKIYYEFSRYINNKPVDIESVVESFKYYSKIFEKIEKPNTNEPDEHPHNQFYYRRSKLNIRATTPVMMKLYEIFVDKRSDYAGFTDATKIIDSFIFRRYILGHTTRRYGKLFTKLLSEINSHDANSFTAKELITSFKALRKEGIEYDWPTDEQVIDKLRDDEIVLPNNVIRVILEAIEHKIRPPNSSYETLYSKLTIEHILPQDDTNWPLPGINDAENERDTREKRKNQIGNLTLASKENNSKLSNATWNEKQKIYKCDNLYLTNNLNCFCDEKGWSEDAIVERGEYLANIICKIWPYEDKCIGEES